MKKRSEGEKNKNPELIGDLLPGILKQLGIKKTARTGLRKINALWARIVGEPLAGNSKVVKHNRGVLYVEVGSPAWMQEARTLDQKKIKDSFMSAEEPVFVAEIRFVLNG